MYRYTDVLEITSSPATYTMPEGVHRNRDLHIFGTHAMAGAITVNFTLPTTSQQNGGFMVYYSASLSNYDIATNYLSIAGSKLPAEYAQKRCLIIGKRYPDSSAWRVFFLPDLSQSAIISSSNIVDGVVAAADLATDAVITSKILDDNVTLPKIENIPDNTILGNVSGGSASPTAIDAEDLRGVLDQDVTLTGHVTGTATQDPVTGVTTVATTISNNTITVAMCTNTVNTDLITIPVSLESSALTAGNAYIAVKVPYACTVEEWGFSVTDLIESTDDATISLYNTAGTLMGSSAVTVTKNTKPSTSAAGGSFFNSSSITSNNSVSTGNIFYIRVQKTTAGGRGFANIKIKRA